MRGRVKRGGESLDLFWNGSLCTAHGKRIAFAIAAAGPRLFCAWMLLFVVFPSEREGKKDTCNVFSNDRNAVINDSSLYITLFETGTRRPTATWDYTARTTNESPRPSTAANTNSESALTISTVRTSLCILSFLFCFFFPRRLSCSRIYGRLRALPAGMIETGRAKHSSSRPHPFLLPCDEEGKELWAHFKFVFHPIRFAVWKMPFQNARRKLVSPSTWKKKHFVCKRRPCNWHAVAGWVTKYRSCVKTSFLSLSLFLFNEKEKKNLKDNNILIIILRVCTYMRTWAAKKGERVNRALSFTVYTSADSSLNDQIRQRSSSVGNLGCDRWIKRRRRRKQNVFKMKRENATTSFHLVPFLLSFRNIKNDDAMVIRLLPSSPSCNTFRRRLLFIPAHSCPIPLRCRKKKKKNESASMLITSQWWEWLPSRPTAERKRIIYDLVSIIFF